MSTYVVHVLYRLLLLLYNMSECVVFKCLIAMSWSHRTRLHRFISFFLYLIIYGGLLIYVGGSFVLVVRNQGKLEVSISTSQQTFKFVIFIIKLTFNNLFLKILCQFLKFMLVWLFSSNLDSSASFLVWVFLVICDTILLQGNLYKVLWGLAEDKLVYIE